MECYQPKRKIDDPSECYFYHRTGLPELDPLRSDWDLRHCVDEYLGDLDYRNQRTLDVGAASGFLSFEMEKRGAEVVSFDMPSARNWDFVPHYQFQEQLDDMVEHRVRAHRRLQNAYWYIHGRTQSRAQVHYGNVYDLPAQLGNFDIVFMGMILGHLRDPFQGIYSASRLCRRRMVITNQASAPRSRRWPGKKEKATDRPIAAFMPSENNAICDSWWGLSSECIENMLGTLGFRVINIVPSNPRCLVEQRQGTEPCISIVAERFAGEPLGAAA